MGALTFKHSAFTSRPWELISVEVPDLLDDQENLCFHLRGSSLLKITSRGWLRDRVRFAYDGFRRQRLIQPLINGEVTSWSNALVSWWNQVYNQKLTLKIDLFQVNSFWLQLLLNRLSFIVTNSLPNKSDQKTYSIDCNIYCSIYHGSYGLECVQFSSLVLPVQLPYEENGVLSLVGVTGFRNFALTVAQLFYQSSDQYDFDSNQLSSLSSLVWSSSYDHQRRACFQVSPLQRFLVG